MTIIEKSRNFPGCYRASELARYGINTFYKVYGTNKLIGIRQIRLSNIQGLTSLVIRESYSEPLYKQAMRMQMGQRPKIIEDRRSYRVKQLTSEELHGKLFEIYETV